LRRNEQNLATQSALCSSKTAGSKFSAYAREARDELRITFLPAIIRNRSSLSLISSADWLRIANWMTSCALLGHWRKLRLTDFALQA
jgi:hypothetical protein